MFAGPDLLSLLNQGLYWLSLLVMVGGSIVCLVHHPLSPMMWLMSLGFAGLVAGSLRNLLVIPRLVNSMVGRYPISLLLLASGIVHLISMAMLVGGLSLVLADLRWLSRQKDSLAEMI